MRTLAIDTSGTTTLVALIHRGDDRRSRLEGQATLARLPLTHLHPLIEALLARLAIGLDAVDRIAVVRGPGSWTGLNIGVTAAKTLAQVLELPLVGLRSLDVLVAVERWLAGPIVGVYDAKRGKVLAATYPTDDVGRPRLAEGHLELLALDAFTEQLAASEEHPRVLELGSGLEERLTRACPGLSHSRHDALPAAGLLAALEVADADPATEVWRGDALFGVAPLYLQEGFQELKAKRRAKAENGGQREETAC